MNSKLTILAKNTPLTVSEDCSVQLELSNPLFNDVEMFSYPVSLPVEGNRHVLKNIDDVNSAVRPMSYEHMPIQILAEGVPLAFGPAVIQEDERVDDTLSMSVDASVQSFADLISNLKCNEVPIPAKYHDSLLIGEKIDEVNVSVRYTTDVVVKYEGKKGDKKIGSVGSYDTSGTFSPQALGFSFPGKCHETPSFLAFKKEDRVYANGVKVTMPEVEQSYINVSDPYPIKPFCNARVCYGHHDINDDGTTSDSLVEYLKGDDGKEMFEDCGPIWALDADRPQSGICFYVLFFLDCLFDHLGVTFDNSALTAIGDLKRLCFFTTKCAYDTKPLHFGDTYKENDPEVLAGKKKAGDIKYGCFRKTCSSGKDALKNLFNSVNDWLDSRGCGGKLKLENPKDKTLQQIVYYPVMFRFVDEIDNRFPDKVFKKAEIVKMKEDSKKTAIVGQDGVASITSRSSITGAEMNASVVSMYANEKNFPDEDVQSVIDSLEQQFGIKFHYDYERKHVTAYLIRDVFRKQNDKPRPFNAEILSMVPITEKITGVRVGYSAESESKEQKKNITDSIKDYATDYDYIEYPKDRTVTSLTYKEIIHTVYNGQMNVFVDLQTGNSYRVKIDSQFTNTNDMHPRLFRVATYKGVEFGDCSDVNEDYVQEYKSDFVPVPLVDTNYRKALSASFDRFFYTDGDVQPSEGSNIPGYMASEVNGNKAECVMVPFIDSDMEHEFVEQYIKNPLSSTVADFYVTEVLSLRESYDPSKTDDGNSPLQSYDWGLTVAIMRGGGDGSSRETYDYDYDGFGNSKWRTTVGNYAVTSDSIDNYGNSYAYNSVDTEEHFSLTPRAWVQPDWADSPLVVSTPSVKNRGWIDTFLVDNVYFLLNRKKFYVRCLASVAQIADIPNHWKEWWNIGGRKCLVNKVNTTITGTDGMGEVEMEVYAF